MRQVVLTKDETGYWVAECPSLPGCNTQGTTREEAIENAKEAIALYIEGLEELGRPVPPETFDALLVAV